MKSDATSVVLSASVTHTERSTITTYVIHVLLYPVWLRGDIQEALGNSSKAVENKTNRPTNKV
jgi:hypothetical protein